MRSCDIIHHQGGWAIFSPIPSPPSKNLNLRVYPWDRGLQNLSSHAHPQRDFMECFLIPVPDVDHLFTFSSLQRSWRNFSGTLQGPKWTLRWWSGKCFMYPWVVPKENPKVVTLLGSKLNSALEKTRGKWWKDPEFVHVCDFSHMHARTHSNAPLFEIMQDSGTEMEVGIL